MLQEAPWGRSVSYRAPASRINILLKRPIRSIRPATESVAESSGPSEQLQVADRFSVKIHSPLKKTKQHVLPNQSNSRRIQAETISSSRNNANEIWDLQGLDPDAELLVR